MGKVTIVLAASILLAGCQSHEREENEVKMRLDEVPPAVREGLTREANGAAIGQVEREEENGRTVYEAHVKSNGKTREISVDASGNPVKDDGEDKD
jgi:uncharacterized membrane protein YkoI